MAYPLQVNSEIGKLRTVLLHRPGPEVENLTPDTLERLLFDDIPFLPNIQKEHDMFAETLRKRDVEVVYLEKLVAESLHTEQLRTKFLDDMLQESEARIDGAMPYLKEYLLSLPIEKMVAAIMAGVRKKEIDFRSRHQHLNEMAREAEPFILDPMPNLYFTRDPAATIANGVSINRMNRTARRRESLFIKTIIEQHPTFAEHDIPIWFNRDSLYPMEGGDQLVLSREVVAIGISERTRPNAIEEMAIEIFKKNPELAKVVAIEIPKKRAFMHLDTVFTMVDYDKFTIHPEIQEENGSIDLYILERSADENYVRITKRRDLFAVLKEILHVSEVALIPCGGGDPVAAAREQWNDGSNTLAIAPGVVVTYDRNYVSNSVLRSHGLEVIEIASSELARGRGGPRCMSMPLFRDEI